MAVGTKWEGGHYLVLTLRYLRIALPWQAAAGRRPQVIGIGSPARFPSLTNNVKYFLLFAACVGKVRAAGCGAYSCRPALPPRRMCAQPPTNQNRTPIRFKCAKCFTLWEPDVGMEGVVPLGGKLLP